MNENVDDLVIDKEDVSLTDKYQKFLLTSATRTIFSRFTSFFYIIIVTRLIVPEILDIMIILSVSLIIFPSIFAFGLNYSIQQKALTSDSDKEAILITGVGFILIVSSSLSMIASVPLIFLTIPNPSMGIFLLYFLAIFLTFLKQAETHIYRSLIEEDKVLLIALQYSVLNSILVPLSFLINPSLEFVLIAWNVAFILSTFPYLPRIIRYFDFRKFDFAIFKYLFRFGFLFFILSVPSLLLIQSDNFIIFSLLPKGSTSVYYFIFRILTVVSEVILIFLTGIFPLFAQIIKTGNKKKIVQIYQSGFRLFFVVSSSIILYFIANHSLIINITISSDNFDPEVLDQAQMVFIFLAIGFFVKNISTYTYQLKMAQGRRIDMTFGSFLTHLFRVGFIFFLISFKLIGVAFAFLIGFSVGFIFYYFITPELYQIPFSSWKRLITYLVYTSSLTFLLIMASEFFAINDWLFVVINSFIFGIAFIIGLFLIKPIQHEDVLLLKRVVTPKLHFIIEFYETKALSAGNND